MFLKEFAPLSLLGNALGSLHLFLICSGGGGSAILCLFLSDSLFSSYS